MFRPASASARQVLHPVGVRVGERQVRPAFGGRDGLVADGEVADVQFVDRRVLRLRELGFAQLRPAGRGQRRRRQIRRDRPLRVGGQRHAVRIGDHVRLDLAGGRRVDLHDERVPRAVPVAATRPGPDPVVVPLHRHGDRIGLAGRDDLQADVLRGGRPHGERRPAPPERHAERALLRSGVQVVEHAGNLHPRRVDQRAGVVERGHRDLAPQDLRQESLVPRILVRQPERVVPGQVRPPLPSLVRQAVRVEGQRDGRATEPRLGVDREAALGRPVQPVGAVLRTASAGSRRPGHAAAIAPSPGSGRVSIRPARRAWS